VVPRYLPRGIVTVMAGPGGSAKSLLCLAWAIAIALGVPFGDFDPIAPRHVIVVNMEDDIEEQRRRIAAIMRLPNAEAPQQRRREIVN
jgi:RecA-family ATPase